MHIESHLHEENVWSQDTGKEVKMKLKLVAIMLLNQRAEQLLE